MTSTTTGLGAGGPVLDDRELRERAQPQRPFRLVRHSVALAGRSVTLIRRNPEALLDVTLTPIIFLLLFVYLFGGAIAQGDRAAYLNFVLPAVLLQTLVFCATYIGVNLNTDITKGVFDRFRSLPIPRSAPLVGAVLGDVVRYGVCTVVCMAAGFAIGFRIQTTAAATVAACLVAIGFCLCLCWAFVLLGLTLRTPQSVQGVSFLLVMPLTFGSDFFVASETLPGFLQGWVAINPLTHVVTCMRGLMLGGPVLWPFVQTLAWSLGLLAVFAPLAVRRYRRRT
jgi:oleandomycin transport system permease protein